MKAHHSKEFHLFARPEGWVRAEEFLGAAALALGMSGVSFPSTWVLGHMEEVKEDSTLPSGLSGNSTWMSNPSALNFPSLWPFKVTKHPGKFHFGMIFP